MSPQPTPQPTPPPDLMHNTGLSRILTQRVSRSETTSEPRQNTGIDRFEVHGTPRPEPTPTPERRTLLSRLGIKWPPRRENAPDPNGAGGGRHQIGRTSRSGYQRLTDPSPFGDIQRLSMTPRIRHSTNLEPTETRGEDLMQTFSELHHARLPSWWSRRRGRDFDSVKHKARLQEFEKLASAMPLNHGRHLLSRHNERAWHAEDRDFLSHLSTIRASYQAASKFAPKPSREGMLRRAILEERELLQQRTETIHARQQHQAELGPRERTVLKMEADFLAHSIRKCDSKIEILDKEEVHELTRPFYDSKRGRWVIGSAAVLGALGAAGAAAGTITTAASVSSTKSLNSGTVALNTTQPGAYNVTVSRPRRIGD